MTDDDRLSTGPLGEYERLELLKSIPRAEIADRLWNGDVRERTPFEQLLPGLATVGAPQLWERGVSMRASNILRSNGMSTWSELAQRDCLYLRRIPNLGRKTFVDIIDALLLAWAEDPEAPHRQPAITAEEPTETPLPRPPPVQNTTIMDLATVLRWLWSRQGASTIEGAVREIWSLFDEDVSPTVREAVARLSETQLEQALGLPAINAYRWEQLLDGLDLRSRMVLRKRYADPPRPLAEIARAFNITRERIRQIEHVAEKQLAERLTEPEFDGLRHLAAGVRREAPGLVTREHFDSLLTGALERSGAPEADIGIYRQLLSQFTDERLPWHGYLAPRDLLDEIAGLRSQWEAAGYEELIDATGVDALLQRMRVPVRSPEVLEHLGLRPINGNLVRLGLSHGDRAVAVLAAHQRELTHVEIHAEISHVSPRSLQSAVAADARIVKRGPGVFGLRVWGGAEYTGIMEELEQALEDAGGRVELSLLVDRLVRDFGVKAGSVLSFAADRRFIKHPDGTLAMRTGDDPEVAVRFVPIEDTAGAYRLDGVWHARVEINEDVLKGLGLSVRKGIALEAGLEPDLSFLVTYDAGPVTLSWRGSQAYFGSVRAIARHHGLGVGDALLLPLSGPEPRTTRPLRLLDRQAWAGVARVGAEMGLDPSDIDEDEQPIEVAEALGLPPGADWDDIVDRLQDRRDPLAEFLPDHLR